MLSNKQNTTEVSILGVTYKIIERDPKDDPKLDTRDAYCDTSSKEIIVSKFEPDPESIANLSAFVRHLKRHEIAHAFFYESGLDKCCKWADNEELVDWLAIQLPKIIKVVQIADAM